MHRRLAPVAAATSAAAVFVILLTGCTATTGTAANPVIADSASATPSPTAAAGGSTHLPTCDAVTTALAGLQADLAFNADVSATQTSQETYEQQVCVYTTPDKATQLG